MRWWFIFACFCNFAMSDDVCCDDSQPCIPPTVDVQYSEEGLHVACGVDIECAWVAHELQTCTCGETWTNHHTLPWQSPIFQQCFHMQKNTSLVAKGTIRWWTNVCMGHASVDIEIIPMPDSKKVFIDFHHLEYETVVSAVHHYVAYARSGSEDPVPQAQKSIMFFECIMKQAYVGVHMKILSCDLEILSSGYANADILTTYHNIQYVSEYADPNGERISFTAFMDDQFYSPWQRIMCTYALFNGTSSVETFHHNSSYMILNPFDSGVIHS